MVRKILISSEILWNVRVIEFWVLTPAGLSVYLLVVIYLHKVHGLEKKTGKIIAYCTFSKWYDKQVRRKGFEPQNSYETRP